MTTGNQPRGIPVTPLPPKWARDLGQTVRWRTRQLSDAGFDDLSARRLATDPDVDLHALLCLQESGVRIGRRLPRRERGAHTHE